MAQAGPYGITQFDAPGIIGAYQNSQENRLRQIILQKQMDREDKAAKEADTEKTGINKAVSAYLGTDAAPAAPQLSPADLQARGPVAPGDEPVGEPSPAAPAAPRVPTAADREKLFSSLVAINPQVAGQYMDAFSKMDQAQASHFKQANDQIVHFAAGLMQLDQKDRPAAVQQAAPEAQAMGIDPQHLANLDLSDQGLRQLIVQHSDAEKVMDFIKPDLMAVGNTVIDKNHPEKGAVYSAPQDFKTISVKNADGSETPFGIDPTTGHAFQLRDYGAPGAQYQGGDPGGFDHAVDTVLKNEGGYAPSDMNGKPVNFGINQGANPDLNVRNMTREQAKQIYHDRYWTPSGAESLPANMQTPYFDVYVRNPAEAKKALAASNGDPQKFVEQTSAYFQQLGQKPTGQKYAKAWANRDANNLAIATGSGGGAGTPITGAPAPHDASDDDTTAFIGGQVALGEPMPPLGMGKESAQKRKANLAEATKQWKEMGISPGEANVIAAQNKSGLAELKKIATMKATVQTAENTANANADQVVSLLGAAGSTGSPIFNAWQQAGRRATGDSKVSAFDVAVKTLSTEYARVMSGGNSAQLSDSARHEADALIHTSMTPDQFRATIKQMKIDMANRSKGIEDERQSTLQQIRTGGQAKEEGWTTLPSGLKVRKVQ